MSARTQPDVRGSADLQEQWTAAWHEGATTPKVDPFERLLERVHRANFDLWHEEDRARDPAATAEEIAAVKHSIDRLNQQRNDAVEEIDLYLLGSLGEQRATAPLHSETPGMMLDRLSILSLKLFHTRIEAERSSATEGHRSRNRDRAALLSEQRSDLVECLARLLPEIQAGTRRFKLYRQLKMYNDPELNPRIYVGVAGAGAARDRDTVDE